MTIDELYAYGKDSKLARACIPKELIQSLPRLELRNGRVIVRYWYYFCHEYYHLEWDKPLYYAAFDIYADKLVEMKALTDKHEFMHSLPGLAFLSRDRRELKYMAHCAALLDRGNITDEEIIHTQAMWLNVQPKERYYQMYTSGIRPEAVEKLIHPEMAETSRYLLWILSKELNKYRMQKAEGFEKLEEIWNDAVFQEERYIYSYFMNRCP